jgi:hypothetical protein
VSPRRHRRKDAAAPVDDAGARRGVERSQEFGGSDWTVRAIPAAAATKVYRCPGCDHEIGHGVAHVVAWDAEGLAGSDARRHWHTGCWRARERRAPRVQRSRDAPRYG